MSHPPAAAGLHPGLPPHRICVALAAATPAQLATMAAEAVGGGSAFLELRLDALADPEAGPVAVEVIARRHPEATLLATCRTVAGSGGFRGSIAGQRRLLIASAGSGAQLIDIEIESLEAATTTELQALRQSLPGTGILLSAHDVTRTGDLEATLRRLQSLGAPLAPAVYKVVTTATCLADNLRMLRFLKEHTARLPLVGICMGEAGVPSRVLAVGAGAPFTFASAAEGRGTAPGQLSAAALRTLYRLDALRPSTRIYGVAGNPITHSLSPVLHNAGFAAAGVDAVYLPLHTTSAQDLWALVQGLPLDGLSVTMPWKVEVLPLLDHVESEAARLGAVNTVARRADGTLAGSNTDLAAIVEPIAEQISLQGARVLVAGAGGAARAAVFGLCAGGAQVTILNRSRPAAERLAAESGASVAGEPPGAGWDAIVNATPAGMAGPLADTLAVQPSVLQGARVVFEMVYRPAQTPLTRLARAQGIPVISGLEMFLRQGIRQWELWTGRAAPREAMQASLEAAIQGEEDGRV